MIVKQMKTPQRAMLLKSVILLSKYTKTFCQHTCKNSTIVPQIIGSTQNKIIPDPRQVDDDFSNIPPEKTNILEPPEPSNAELSNVAPYLQPTFNFAPYMNKSKTLQELLKLGVDLYKIEKKGMVTEYILGLDFERDVKEHVIFFHDLGLQTEELAAVITKNPFIFQESLDDMRVRINYLESKLFKPHMIQRILSKNAFWLKYPVPKIDNKLGFFQKLFILTGDEVRDLTVKQPKLITFPLRSVQVNRFALIEEMGFSVEESRSMLLKKPNIYMKDQNKLLETFNYLHRTMGIGSDVIAKLPEALTCRLFRLKQRHSFLLKLEKVQYNPKEPNFISILHLVSGNDADFCQNVAKVPTHIFNNYLKSL